MVQYKNLSKKSGVTAYEIMADSIKIRFVNGDTYLYTYQSAGRRAIERMKKLAVSGRHLSTYISQAIKDRFAKKLE